MKKRIVSFLLIFSFTLIAVGCGANQNHTDASAEGSSIVEETTDIKNGAGGETTGNEVNAKVSYLGPAGTYTEEATQFFFGDSASLIPEETVDDAIAELSSGGADYAVIPQENTLGGAVVNYIDSLIGHTDVYVVGEVVLPISQTLMGVPGTELSDIKTVCSHTQGIQQTKEWRDKNLPDAVTQEMDSTAAAASYVAETGDKSIAAIAAPGAADLYGLEVLAENVQISLANKTRFYVLSTKEADSNHSHAVLAATCTADKIDDIIIQIHDAGLEMVAIHDRPEGSALGSYHYIIELENSDGITEAQLKAINSIKEIHFYGTFDAVEKE